MSNTYNFDTIVSSDQPEIIMAGQKYNLRYPTVEEIEKLQSLKTDEERTDALYTFIVKTDDGQPDFKTILKKQDIRVLKQFSNMIKKEFGITE